MTSKDQLDSQISSSSFNHPEQASYPTLQEELSLLSETASPTSVTTSISPTASITNQKVEITFANGHRFCLEGSFDWEIVSTWLTPLLTQD